jgi:rfaE bifunctional protein kinase chain/domain
MNLNRFLDITSGFKDKKIMVVGDLMLDVYYWGDAHRISQEAPVPIVKVEKENIRMGGAGNVTQNLFELGCHPILIGVLGCDHWGSSFMDLLNKKQILTTGLVTEKNRVTTVKTRIIAQNQQMIRMDQETTTPVPNVIENQLLLNVKNNLPNVDGIIIADYGKGTLTHRMIKEINALAQKHTKPLFIDPKKIDKFLFNSIHFIKPNSFEFHELVGDWTSNNELKLLGHNLREKWNIDTLLVTLSSDGSVLFTKDKTTFIPTKALKVHDVSGAGDTVISTFALAELSGATGEEAALMGNFAAGYVCGEVGVVSITLEKLTKMFKYHLS